MSSIPAPVPFPVPVPATQVQRDGASANDAALVARVRAGDQAAYESLFRAHYDALWRFAYHQVGSAEAAREIVQDVFFALWRNRAAWEITSSVTGWLYGSVRHHALRHRRNERTIVRITNRAARAATADAGEHATDDALGVAMGARTRDAQTVLEEQELDEAVTRAVATLPERRRLAMTLRLKHDLAAPEIARLLGTTPQAVRLLLMRARQEIAALLVGRDA